MKILLTGDCHLGKSYNKEQNDVAEALCEARIKAVYNLVEIANQEKCDFLIIAGDLYDKVSGISDDLIKRSCQILTEFTGQAVLILPGNHDYYDTKSDKLWKVFEDYSGSNIRVFKKCEKYQINNVVFYPCVCNSKRSETNALQWLKDDLSREKDLIHIGIAHGAVENYSLDSEKNYYHMSIQELQECNMDAWLIGHTHVDFADSNSIFNAGTPQQTDISDNSKSFVYILKIEKNKDIILDKKKTGVIDFIKKEIVIKPEQNLQELLDFSDITQVQRNCTAIRVYISGIASPDDYNNKEIIYEELSKEYLKFEIKDENLHKAITPDMIDQITMSGSRINNLMKLYENDFEILNLIYELVEQCKQK